MASLLALLRVTRRSGLGRLLGLALIIGLAGGAVLTGVESYRRTDSAFDRLIVETEAWDVLVNPDFGTQSALRVEDIAALPGVEQVARADGLALSPRTIDSLEDIDRQPAAFASDGRWGYDFARPRIRAGHMPAVDAPDEAFLSAAPADSMGLGVLDVLEARLLSIDDFGALEAAGGVSEGVDLFNDPSTGQLQSLERVRSTPLWLTGLLVALIVLTVVHALVAAVRSRRREVAVLRTLGFTRRQVMSAVAVQAGIIGGVGLAIGVPIGLVVGRLAWRTLAERLGAVVELVTPVSALGVLAVAVLGLALLVGLVPGLRAARAHPAHTLRTE